MDLLERKFFEKIIIIQAGICFCMCLGACLFMFITSFEKESIPIINKPVKVPEVEVIRRSPYSVVNAAFLKYGSTILSYEVPNSHEADREFVACVLLNNLKYRHAQRPSLDANTLMAYLAKKWNPNMHATFKDISREVRTNRKTSPLYGREALARVVSGNFQTEEGRFACENFITEFAHMNNYPSYYVKKGREYKFKGKLKASGNLKHRIVFARDPIKFSRNS